MATSLSLSLLNGSATGLVTARNRGNKILQNKIKRQNSGWWVSVKVLRAWVRAAKTGRTPAKLEAVYRKTVLSYLVRFYPRT
jgi:hypothetical protein